MRLTTTHKFSMFSGIVTTAALAVLGGSGCSGSSDSSTGPTGSGGADSAGGTGESAGGTATGAGGTVAGGAQGTGGLNVGGGTSKGTTSAAGGTTGGTAQTGGAKAVGGVGTTGGGGNPTGGTPSTGGSKTGGGAPSTGGTEASVGGATAVSTAGAKATGGAPSAGGANTGGSKTAGGATSTGGSPSTGGLPGTGGSKATGGAPSTGGSKATGGATSAGGCASGPIGTFTGALATGITFTDDGGKPVNAHGGGIIKVGSTYYMHGEYFLSTTTDNNFNGFSMYSSQDMATWKNEGIILPQQASGMLGPNRKGERPHIIKCPSTGEFVLYAHSADVTYQADKEVVYATSATVNGQYSFKGSLTNAGGTIAAHSDMSALSDGNNAYVVTESGHVYTLAADCHSWLSDTSVGAVNGDSGGSESPTVFKAGSTYYWIGSYKTGWRANNNFYSTASAMTGPWTYQGFVAPVTDTSTTTPTGDPNPPEWISDQRTWLSQSTWVQPVVGCQGTVYVFWGDHWYGDTDTSNPGKHNDQATYVFQPLVFNGTKISMPTYHSPWSLDVGLGTWQ